MTRLTIPARLVSYVEDDDAFVRGTRLGPGRYEFEDDDARAVVDHLRGWRDTLRTEPHPSPDLRADLRALERFDVGDRADP